MYECIICNYSSKLKSNYNRHNLSKRHIKNMKYHIDTITQTTTDTEYLGTTKKPRKTTNLFTKNHEFIQSTYESKIVCKYCNKLFKHKNSMYYHIKYSCKENKDEDLRELVRLLNLQLEQQKTETEKKDKQLDQHIKIQQKKDKQLENQQKQIDKLMDKLQVPQITNNTMNNNIHNNIRLSYKDTDVSHLTDADYRKSVNCLLMCVKTFIGIVHLDPTHPENMNIYISNLKDKYIMVYTGETWELKNRQYEMDSLYDHNEMLLSEWVKEHGNHDLQDKFKRYLEHKEQSIEMIHEEIKLMLYNKRHLAICE